MFYACIVSTEIKGLFEVVDGFNLNAKNYCKLLNLLFFYCYR